MENKDLINFDTDLLYKHSLLKEFFEKYKKDFISPFLLKQVDDEITFENDVLFLNGEQTSHNVVFKYDMMGSNEINLISNETPVDINIDTNHYAFEAFAFSDSSIIGDYINLLIRIENDSQNFFDKIKNPDLKEFVYKYIQANKNFDKKLLMEDIFNKMVKDNNSIINKLSTKNTQLSSNKKKKRFNLF
jgi:hypothetical protein